MKKTYTKRVEKALELDPDIDGTMPKIDYIEALEELSDTISGMLDAARDELEAGDEGR